MIVVLHQTALGAEKHGLFHILRTGSPARRTGTGKLHHSAKNFRFQLLCSLKGTHWHKIINSHAQAAFLMVSIVFAAGAFTGVVKNSGMLASMTDALVSIIPTSMGTFIAPIVGLFSVPLSLLFDPDSYYYGVMPVIANAVSAMGGNALAVAKASIMGQMTLGFPLSPLTGATFLLLGLSGQDLGDHQKHTLPYAWVASAIMVAVGCVACGLLF